MKILLDENLDWRLRRDLPGHTVESVPLLGWSGLKNGALLARAEEHQFDALLTMDTNMAFQQDLSKFKIIVISLHARSNRLADTRPLMPKVSKLLVTAKPGALVVVTP